MISKISDALRDENSVERLADRPNETSRDGVSGLTPQQLKEFFDRLPKINTYKINEIIDVVNECLRQGGSISTEGIIRVSKEYYLSTSKTVPVGGTWQSTPPSLVTGKYIFSRIKMLWSDGSATYSPSANGELDTVSQYSDAEGEHYRELSQEIDELISKIGLIEQTVDENTERIITSETEIEQNAAAIALRATKTELNELGETVNDQSSTLTIMAGKIASKVAQTAMNALTRRVESAESEIEQQAGEITLKVSAGEIISKINQSAEEVKILASKINLEGVTTFVKPSDLGSSGTTVIDGGRIQTGQIQSANYTYSSGDFSTTGSKIDLTSGWIRTPGLYSDINKTKIKGEVEATSGNIGGWTVYAATGLHYISRTPTGLQGGMPLYLCGDNDWPAAYNSPIGQAYGGAINGLAIRIGESATAKFGIGYNGALYATDAYIRGEIEATSGTFGKLSIGNNRLNFELSDLNTGWFLEEETTTYGKGACMSIFAPENDPHFGYVYFRGNKTTFMRGYVSHDERGIILDAYNTYLSDQPSILLMNRLGGTCLIEGTKILMADGTEKSIEDVKTGDLILSYNPQTKENCEAMALMVECTGVSKDYTAMIYQDGSFAEIFGRHSIWREQSEKVVDIEHWNVGNYGRMNDGSTNQLISKEPIEHGVDKKHYLLISSNNLYYANGILMGHGTATKYRELVKNPPKDFPQEILEHYLERIEANKSRREYAITPQFLEQGAGILKRMRFAEKQIADDEASLASSDYKTTHRLESFFVSLKRLKLFTLSGIKALIDGLDELDDSKRNEWRDRINAKRAEKEAAAAEYKALKDRTITRGTTFAESVADGNLQLEALKEWRRKQ